MGETTQCQVRLPRTATRRSAVTFAKILERVAPSAVNGFDFEGRFVRPGSEMVESDLPARAVLLEGAGSDGSGEKTSQYLYVLWEYDRKASTWRELAWVWAESWEWALELGPLARRALEPVRELPDLRRVGERLAALIERELAPLEARQRAQVAGVLHDQFAARMVAWAAAA